MKHEKCIVCQRPHKHQYHAICDWCLAEVNTRIDAAIETAISMLQHGNTTATKNGLPLCVWWAITDRHEIYVNFGHFAGDEEFIGVHSPEKFIKSPVIAWRATDRSALSQYSDSADAAWAKAVQ